MNIMNQWQGKKWYCYGTSMTDNTTLGGNIGKKPDGTKRPTATRGLDKARRPDAEKGGVSEKMSLFDRIYRTPAVHIASISAISGKCGYSETGIFCRAFKKNYGVTPTEYRKDNRSNC